VILMEDGWRTRVSYKTLISVKCGEYHCFCDKSKMLPLANISTSFLGQRVGGLIPT